MARWHSSATTTMHNDLMHSIEFEEFLECIARNANDKYSEVVDMTLAQRLNGFCKNLLRQANEEEVGKLMP